VIKFVFSIIVLKAETKRGREDKYYKILYNLIINKNNFSIFEVYAIHSLHTRYNTAILLYYIATCCLHGYNRRFVRN